MSTRLPLHLRDDCQQSLNARVRVQDVVAIWDVASHDARHGPLSLCKSGEPVNCLLVVSSQCVMQWVEISNGC